MNRQLVIIGMPCWEVTKPFHAVAQVAGVARDAGFNPQVYDVNIDFYNHSGEDEKKLVTEDYNHLWFTEQMPRELWKKHEEWLNAYLDDIAAARPRPTLIAFSVNMSTRFFSVYAARYLKEKLADVPIMFGGVDCFPRERNKAFLAPDGKGQCDIICQGESEIAFREFLQKFGETGDWKTCVPGFAYYDGADMVNTGDTQLPTLREKLPIPAYDQFDLSKYTLKGSLPFFLSRGCVYKCNFCSEGPNFRSYRFRRAEEAFEELAAILPYARKYTDTPTLNLADSIINANIKELKKFVDLIMENGVKIVWSGQGHIHDKMTRELLERMRAAGFVSFFWGMESGSQNVVNLMNKRFSQEVAARIIEDCIEIGIRQHIPMLIGFPGETPEDVADTVAFILRYKDRAGVHIHLPCHIVIRPNSPLYDNYTAFGLADRLGYEWRSADNKNNLSVRIARRFVARQAHGNPELSMEKLVDTEEIKSVKLNDPVVAEDLCRLLREMQTRGGLNETALDQWMRLDKDTPHGREQVYRSVLAALRALREKVRENDRIRHQSVH